MSECIKWKSPTFSYKGNLASFNPRTKKYVSLMFHRSAGIPGDFPRLEGGGETVRYMKLEDMAAVEATRAELEAVVQAWCTWVDGLSRSSDRTPESSRFAWMDGLSRSSDRTPESSRFAWVDG